MLNFIVNKIFGTHNDRQLRKIMPLVKKINELESDMASLKDEDLKAKTDEFKARLQKGETLDDILPEAFAAMREACKRTLNMRPYDVQLIGGYALHKGMIAEMTTGEGKTLVATLPAYLNALDGKGVHIVTVNDYLASRDRSWMGPAYEFMGLTVGAIQHGTPIQDRRKEYATDITYGTNNEFGFDYLKDNMVIHHSLRVQRALNFAIVDEVDSILIDEARTPLIISGPSEESTDKYYELNRLAPKLSDGDFTVDEKIRNVILTDQGVKKVEEILQVENLYDPGNVELVHHVNQALRAHKLYKRDVDYVVQNNEVVIVDEFTGRLLPGRRLSDGLHQAIEAKENVKIEKENQTLASVTFQNYFRMYKKLSGMTGTAATEAQEFFTIYKLHVLSVPTNKSLARKNLADAIYRTEREKFNAVIGQIIELHEKGRPVLVGTISIEKSEVLSQLLRKQHIPHNVLNAKYHDKEAEIIKLAGQNGAVTIATNMAGRGTDIVLGEGVAEMGGLHVIGTERHESRRIDNQLRGRTGRQGDPGSSQFFISLEDDLMRIFGSDRISNVMAKLGMEEGQSIQHGLVTRSIESAQSRVEGHNFDIRKAVLKYDDVMNQQRLAIYSERKEILEGGDLKERYKVMCEEILDDGCEGLNKAQSMSDDEKALEQQKEVADYLKSVFIDEPDPQLQVDAENYKEAYMKLVMQSYEDKEKTIGQDVVRNMERMVLLEVMDSKWKDHLRNMDELRQAVDLRVYGQKDPIVEYRREGFEMFEEMTRRIKEDSLRFIMRMQPPKEEDRLRLAQRAEKDSMNAKMKFIHPTLAPLSDQMRQKARSQNPNQASSPVPGQKPTQMPIKAASKVGRNEPCPCGSGKKYKKCCGA